MGKEEKNMTPKQTRHIVRQILMNEMGLSREVIRDELHEIILETAQKKINRMMKENELRKMVRDFVWQYFSPKSYMHDNKLESEIKKAVASEVSEFIKEHITIIAK